MDTHMDTRGFFVEFCCRTLSCCFFLVAPISPFFLTPQTERQRNRTQQPTAAAGKGIEMTSPSMVSTGTHTNDSKKDNVTGIVMKTNPMSKAMQHMKSQMTALITNGEKVIDTDSNERPSTDLVIGEDFSTKWVKYVDPESGKPYWHNTNTDETTWDDPKTKSHGRTVSQWA